MSKYAFATLAKNPKGVVKLYFTNDRVSRGKRMQKTGFDHTGFIEFPKPLNKLDAARYLLDSATMVKTPNTESAIVNVITRFTSVAKKKAPAKKKVAKRKTAKKTAKRKYTKKVVAPVFETTTTTTTTTTLPPFVGIGNTSSNIGA